MKKRISSRLCLQSYPTHGALRIHSKMRHWVERWPSKYHQRRLHWGEWFNPWLRMRPHGKGRQDLNTTKEVTSMSCRVMLTLLHNSCICLTCNRLLRQIVVDPLVMVVDSNRQYFLGIFLSHNMLIQVIKNLGGREPRRLMVCYMDQIHALKNISWPCMFIFFRCFILQLSWMELMQVAEIHGLNTSLYEKFCKKLDATTGFLWNEPSSDNHDMKYSK